MKTKKHSSLVLLNYHLMIRQSVLISFPLGAKFNKNPKLVVYRQFLNMVRKLSCVNIEGKCYTCPMQKSCTYYKVSGEELTDYVQRANSTGNYIEL